MIDRAASLPKLLVSGNGENIVTSEQWLQQRRPELLSLFSELVYGMPPVQRPEALRFNVDVKEGMMNGTCKRKQVSITYEGAGGQGSMRLVLFVPQAAPKPVPAFLLINNRGSEVADPDRNAKSPFWPAEYIVSHGYAAAVFQVEDLDPDFHDGFSNGVHGIFDPPDRPRSADAWGTIAAWAWGASRAMDYFEADPVIDAERVALVGHSRGGKTALWAGAVDSRFAMVVSNNSGCTGAAIARGKQGETIKAINSRFPHWFAENYKRFNDKEFELPVDQHMLLSLIAPRPLYVASASEDAWADPESEFLSLSLTEPVYRLFGYERFGFEHIPEPDHPIFAGNVGYHLRTGKHNLLESDWKCFIEFADRHLKSAGPPA